MIRSRPARPAGSTKLEHKETRTRSLVKTIFWRILATLITWATLYLFTKKVTESLKITVVAAVLSMIAYYIHERIWNRIKWGKEPD